MASVDGDGTPIAIHIYELADIQPPVLIPAFYPSKYRPQQGEALTINAELLTGRMLSRPWTCGSSFTRATGKEALRDRFSSRSSSPASGNFQPKKSIKRKQSLPLPVPPGVYTVQLKVGTFPDQVTDTRWFSVGVR